MSRQEICELINALFETSYSHLVRYANRRSGNVDIAQDLVQDCFTELFQELWKGHEVRNPQAWVFCVLRRKLGKQSALHTELVDSEVEAIAAPQIGDPDELDDLAGMFSVLTKREEEVLLLRLGALKYQEIASQLGISINSVTTLIARALRKLRVAAGTISSPERTVPSHAKPISKTLH
jgi:RNA polymerase sigma factor (sigma-70 family)